jgi:hypothetical protein
VGKRGLGVGLVVVALAATTFIGSAALRPAKAHAFAWQNVCVSNTFNRSGSQSAVRPYVYVPLPPDPASLSLYAVYLAAGIPPNPPGNFDLSLRNTGWPVPTYGCYATLYLRAPGPNVSCKYSAPTSGGNSFVCGGDSSVTILANTNNIVANIQIPRQGGNGGSRVRAARPRRGPPAIRPGQLPVDGWRGTQKLRHIGLVGRLMKTGRLPASCQGGGDRRTRKVSSNLLVNPGGGRGVGAVVGTYRGKHAAHQTAADALSRHSIRCLARLLTSHRLKTTANSQRIHVAGGGGLRGVQMVVRRKRHGTVRRAAFMDVIAASKGNQMGLLMLPSAHREMGARVLRAAVNRMLDRIGA